MSTIPDISNLLNTVIKKASIEEVPFAVWIFFGFGFSFLLERHSFQVEKLLASYSLNGVILFSIAFSILVYILLGVVLSVAIMVVKAVKKPFKHGGTPSIEPPIVLVYSLFTAGIVAFRYAAVVQNSSPKLALIFGLLGVAGLFVVMWGIGESQ